MPFTSLLHAHPSGIRYSLQWLYWVLPDLRSRRLTWGWGSLLSRNPAHSAVPIALRMKFPFLDSIAGLELPEVCHMLMDLVWLHTFFFFQNDSMPLLVSPHHWHFLTLAPWSCWLECPSMSWSLGCELWHIPERMLELKGILKVQRFSNFSPNRTSEEKTQTAEGTFSL